MSRGVGYVVDTGDSGGAVTENILVVDDNAAMRQHVASALGEVGRVLVAADGVEALEVLARGDVDLVVSDVMMPRLDGEGLVAAIRESPDRPDVPVILLSARAGSEAAISARVVTNCAWRSRCRI